MENGTELKVSDILKKKGAGFKAVLEVDLPELKVIVPIRHETMNSKDIKEKHKVVFKDSTGQEVNRKFVGEAKTLKWLNSETGTEAVGGVQAWQEGVAVEPFEKTEDIKIVKTAPKEIKDDFLLERTIEIWSEEVDKIYKVADYLHSNNLVGLASVVLTKGYDTQYLCLIEPRFIDGNKFGLVGYLVKKHLIFNHLLDLADMGKRQATQKAKALDLVEGILV
jgi:hypothetical protein